MKILFLNDGIHAFASGAHKAVGGAERQQWYLARALAESGWRVVVGLRDTLQPGERCAYGGVEFVGMECGQIAWAWRRFLDAERPDWCYWRGAGHLYGPAVALAKLSGVRTIFAAAFDRDVQPRRALSRRRRWWPLYAWGLAWTDRIMVQHRGQFSALAPRLRSKAWIIPSMAGPAPDVKSHRERAGHVAWVAMLREPKRPDILIELARRLPRTRFVVCGGPSHHRSPQGYGDRMAAAFHALPNIEYLGQVSPARAQEIIAAAGVLLSTSDEEGFPNTFLEAWISGTPVASLSVDPDNRLRDLKLGTVSGSVDALAADVGSLLSSPERRDEIAIRARAHVSQSHSQAVVVAAFQRALQDPDQRRVSDRRYADPSPGGVR
jgi:glycosyltransferase involved in cell wall biosynthesis